MSYAILDQRKFRILESEDLMNAWAAIGSGADTKLVFEESKLSKTAKINGQGDFRVISFDIGISFPIEEVIDVVSKKLKDSKISFFVAAAYMTNHMLIKQEDLGIVVEILTDLGFSVR